MSGSSIRWAICKSATRSRQITTPAPHHSLFYRPDDLPVANQQHISSEGKNNNNNNEIKSQEPTLHSINCTKHTLKFGLCRQLGGIQSCRRMTTLWDWTRPCCVNTGQNLTSTILFTDRTTAPLSGYSQCQICIIS